MRRWDGLVERYAESLGVRGLSAATIDTRTRELVRFGTWLKNRRPRPQIEQVDADTVLRYIRTRTAFHARATVCGITSDLRCMGEFLVQEELWRTNPLRWIRGPKIDPRRQVPRRIGREQLKALWEAAHSRPQEHARYQALCVLGILYGTGLRRGELERLSVQDWDRDNSILAIDGRKTGHPRRVPVGQGVWRCIEAYLPRRHNRLELTGRLEEQALLVNTRGERLSGDNVSTLVARLSACAGIARVTMHQFRHSCASDLLEAGVTLPEVQSFLGHATIQTTVRYLQIADPQRAVAMDKHPINRFLAVSTPDAERKAS